VLNPDQQTSARKSVTLPFDHAVFGEVAPVDDASPWIRHADPTRTEPTVAPPRDAAGWVPEARQRSDDPGVEPAPAAAPRTRETMALLWYSPEVADRIRSDARWTQLIDAADAEGSAERLVGAEPEREDRRDVTEVLLGGKSCELIDLRERLARAEYAGAPLMLFGGELALGYDPARELRATIDIAAAVAPDDEKVRAAATRGEALLSAESFVSAKLAAEVTKQLNAVLREAAMQLPSSYLEHEARRAVVLGRHYERRELFGGPQLVAHFRFVETQGVHIVCYLLEALADHLPLYQRLPVRMLAELHPRVDDYAPGALALRCMALAWRPPPMSV
jgi:hypothetical protein